MGESYYDLPYKPDNGYCDAPLTRFITNSFRLPDWRRVQNLYSIKFIDDNQDGLCELN